MRFITWHATRVNEFKILQDELIHHTMTNCWLLFRFRFRLTRVQRWKMKKVTSTNGMQCWRNQSKTHWVFLYFYLCTKIPSPSSSNLQFSHFLQPSISNHSFSWISHHVIIFFSFLYHFQLLIFTRDRISITHAPFHWKVLRWFEQLEHILKLNAAAKWRLFL